MAGASQAWALELDAAFAKDMEGVLGAVIRVAVYGNDQVKRHTPVDTGNAKNNWIVSVGQPNGATVEYPGTLAAESAAALASYPKEGWPVIYIQNNLPYALALEHGHSKKAPAGMAAISIPEIEAYMQGIEI